MSTGTPKPELAHVKSCADVIIHTARALADALEACQANGSCDCGCCGSCGPSKAA